ncbi:MAG: hypothetical protein ACRC9X_01830 [Bacteroidales bacterium]
MLGENIDLEIKGVPAYQFSYAEVVFLNFYEFWCTIDPNVTQEERLRKGRTEINTKVMRRLRFYRESYGSKTVDNSATIKNSKKCPANQFAGHFFILSYPFQ